MLEEKEVQECGSRHKQKKKKNDGGEIGRRAKAQEG